ncbi:uncharacterized protein ARMOST_02619 [Armillaria ostoyae]|uniref:Uncharacterized protein n=1 Tax=Armillaria ostoyae TaxID=47428 RepID=A0A284QS78_ARMOS|nr:uncharacterized protein ARMOST_02619 [Armillaria ostoyae]
MTVTGRLPFYRYIVTIGQKKVTVLSHWSTADTVVEVFQLVAVRRFCLPKGAGMSIQAQHRYHPLAITFQSVLPVGGREERGMKKRHKNENGSAIYAPPAEARKTIKYTSGLTAFFEYK